MEDVLKYIDVYDPRFCVAVIAIIFNPFFWNVVSNQSIDVKFIEQTLFPFKLILMTNE